MRVGSGSGTLACGDLDAARSDRWLKALWLEGAHEPHACVMCAAHMLACKPFHGLESYRKLTLMEATQGPAAAGVRSTVASLRLSRVGLYWAQLVKHP